MPYALLEQLRFTGELIARRAVIYPFDAATRAALRVLWSGDLAGGLQGLATLSDDRRQRVHAVRRAVDIMLDCPNWKLDIRRVGRGRPPRGTAKPSIERLIDRWISKLPTLPHLAEVALRQMVSEEGIGGWRLVARRRRGRPKQPPPGIGEHDHQIEEQFRQGVKVESIIAGTGMLRSTFYRRKRSLGLYRQRETSDSSPFVSWLRFRKFN